MASARGSETTPVADRLFGEPQRFSFFQAVRLLKRLRPEAPAPGEGDEPGREPVRFATDVSLSFPPSDVAALDRSRDEASAPRMAVPFFGVASPASYGSLPASYTEFVRAEARLKNDAPREFLDLFNHRLVALFYRAWEKHRFAVGYERAPAGEGGMFERALFSILGLGTAAHRRRLPLPDLALLRWAGVFARGRATVEGLERVVEGYFGVPAAAEQFVLRRHVIEPGELAPLGLGARLGQDTILGRTLPVSQGHLRLVIGPVERRTFTRFLPTGDAFPALREIVRFATGGEIDFDVRLVLRAKDVPSPRLSSRARDGAPRLGWFAWLGTRPRDRDASEVVIPEHSRSRAAA